MRPSGRFTLALIIAMSVVATLVFAGCSDDGLSRPASQDSSMLSEQDAQLEDDDGSAERRAANEKTSLEFMRAFYNDWEFEGGSATYSAEPFNRRSLPFIAEGSALYDELSKDNSFGVGSSSRFARTAALHAVEVRTGMRSEDVCVVDVSFCGTQNDVTQEWYDDMMKRLNNATWTLVFDENGKVVAMEEGDASSRYIQDSGIAGDKDDNLQINRTISFYVEMESSLDFQAGVSRAWKPFDAASETPVRLARLAFAYLYRHDHASVESCSASASSLGANAPAGAEYNVRVKRETLEDAVDRLYGVKVNLETVTSEGQWGDPHYHDGYVYFFLTNGVGYLAGAALADSVSSNADGTYQVKCGIYSNHTGNTFNPDDDSVYSGTPEELMRRYGDVERVADATAVVRREGDGRWTLQKFIQVDHGESGATSKAAVLFESGYGDVRVRLTPGFSFINQPSSTCNWDLSLTAVSLSGLVYSNEAAADALKSLGYDEARYSYRDELMHTTTCFGYRNEGGKNVFAIVVRGTRGGTGGEIDLLTDIVDGGTAMFDSTKGYVMEDFEEFAKNATGKTIEQLKSEENYFFITGHSLGAAVANCLSVDGEITELAASDKNRIYTYTFESPHTCINLWWMDPVSMSNAYNYKDNDDAVTHLPPYAGSATYGTDISFDVNHLDNDVFTTLFPNTKGGNVTEAPKEENYGSGIAGQTLGHHDRGLDLTLIVQEGIANGVWQSADDVLA